MATYIASIPHGRMHAKHGLVGRNVVIKIILGKI